MEKAPLFRPTHDYGAASPVIMNAAETSPEYSGKLNISAMSYTVKETVGPWYTGACLKRRVEKRILKNIDMSFSCGEVAAIVGGSGSGKTSLLDVIASRYDGHVTGKMYYNNKECSRSVMASCTSYVIQADRLLPHLTVRETLRFTAYLCLPGTTTSDVIDAKVNDVIQKMGLIKVADSLVGGAVVRGLSGGEKRRVSIATQLLKDPDILLLDEPTTGLDSFTARYLVKNLRQLALSGKIVVMTIHQPRSDIFKLFDQVAILSQGEITYFGRSDDIVNHFTRLNFPCPAYANPLDVYIDVCSIDRRTPERERDSKLRIEELVKAYRNSRNREAMVNSINSSLHIQGYGRAMATRDGPGPVRKLTTIYSRMNRNLFRDRGNVVARACSGPMNVILILAFLGKLGFDQNSIQNRGGLVFNCLTTCLMSAILLTVYLFPFMREVYYRECKEGLYASWYFIVAHVVHTLPFHILSSLILSSMCFWICGMYVNFRFFCELTVLFLIITMIHENVTVAMLGLIYNYQLANTLMGLLSTLGAIVASGFFRAIESLPDTVKWLGYSSPVKYVTEIIMANEYSNINITCANASPDLPCLYPTSESYLEKNYPHAVNDHDKNYGFLSLIYVASLVFTMMVFAIKKVPNLH